MKNFSYEVARQKLIYVFGIADAKHKGLLKIGDTTFTGNLDADARTRINSYTRTAAVDYELLHTELAVTYSGDAFRDYDVHRVLKNSNIKRKKLRNAREWFKVDIDTVKKAIEAVKRGRSHIDAANDVLPEFIFRAEQQNAIARTVKHFKKHDQFLWNAKMRFGKTSCALEVVRQMNFAKTIIVTHRPVVNESWYAEFNKIFRDGSFDYFTTETFSSASDKNFVYFASIQDLRGSEDVGGKFVKNAEIFATDWNCVIVDEAHEGTKTPLGDSVIKKLINPKTKLLALSGTPFNIIDDFDEEATFTWDYVMEQRAKADWDKNFPDLPNPYADLPRMNILTYDLGKLFGYVDDKSFDLSEFFRTEGDNFVHAADVKNFLNLLVKRDENNYPFSREQWRNMFRHTLWIVPGVKEGRALSRMLQAHKVFGSFKIVNVAGDGDSDDEPADALTKVKTAIEEHDCTITLSCGKLTAGVTVPEWSAVFMLKGGSSAMSYLQTIFRVQTPCRKGGVVKENCYVFDFAPDRTLKVVADAVAVSTRAGKTTDAQRQALGEFLKFCPVIAMHGSRMKELNADKLIGNLKRAYIDRVVRRGFDDNYLYNDELLNLNEHDLDKFAALGNLIGVSDAKTSGKVIVNDQGLTGNRNKKSLPKDRSPEEIELARRKRRRLNAIKNLRGISIRMPLLIYGAEVPLNEEITIDKFADLIDDDSWAEFMPKGVTKEFFAEFIKYYDPEVFINSGNEVRNRALNADELPPAERVEEIAALFDTFKNPDKETVLTPWRVVDLHLSSLPADIFARDKKILDINSKTGLYGLWTALKIYRAQLGNFNEDDFTPEARNRLWNEIVAENVFVVCKTPMAVKITRRTLLGYRGGIVNAECFDDLIPTLKHTPSTFIERVTDKNFWHKGVGKMFFDAVVGNPPYQNINDSGNFAPPIYHLFLDTAFKLADKVSLIHPARCLFNAGASLGNFNREILDDKHFKVVEYYSDAKELFPTSNIEGGIVISIRDTNENFGALGTFINFAELDSILQKVVVDNPNFQPFSEIVYSRTIYRLTDEVHKDFPDAANNLSNGHRYDVSTNIFNLLPKIFLDAKPDDGHDYVQIFGKVGAERVYKWIRRDYVNNPPPLEKFKVFVPKSNGASGKLGKEAARIISKPVVGEPFVGNTETFINVGAFDTRAEADACIAYIKTKFCRAMLGILKVTQDNPPDKWAKVPMQDFTSGSDIDWSVSIPEIDAQLYRKYNLSDAEIKFIESKVKAMD